ncbi:putative FKBP-type peptidyl-prolyl cis-trans isomerase [Monocercomonoides exilis]|uniref:putative FKBP-type peptidyl-prolyl cis-trans isomerase n=1 Tax=Monocercomonoides exilis TaxID=2049356 RepID=UPI00355AA963|nr:putative FKBP-type peptidyl-prolyl cis-trans isomerase [Monocercomonoides exilis]|eukprot:MONOS_4362.1-p1 / transcript=MONOS_4362.1 / gene=MONOS_4362 / organism=Monocercomonoides_exilis_PA203 / gene_product=unspecified product / transcript_product=unspecified product / location=Mono_scaffold00115:49064-49917(-) / protein_length=227 / sequence_SO=supercontig / SO=protein_coding / is_pseudo=false
MHLLYAFLFLLLSNHMCAQSTTNSAGLKRKPPSKLVITNLNEAKQCENPLANNDIIEIAYNLSLFANQQLIAKTGNDESFILQVGKNQVVSGLEEGILGMCPGERRHLIVPSNKAYGKRGSPDGIPPFSSIELDVELLNNRHVKDDETVDISKEKSKENRSQKPLPRIVTANEVEKRETSIKKGNFDPSKKQKKRVLSIDDISTLQPDGTRIVNFEYKGDSGETLEL